MSTYSTLSAPLPGQSGGLFHLVQSALAYVAKRMERMRVSQHLSGLDDRLLADLGFARGDIDKLFH